MEKALWRAEKLKSCGKIIGISILSLNHSLDSLASRVWLQNLPSNMKSIILIFCTRDVASLNHKHGVACSERRKRYMCCTNYYDICAYCANNCDICAVQATQRRPKRWYSQSSSTFQVTWQNLRRAQIKKYKYKCIRKDYFRHSQFPNIHPPQRVPAWTLTFLWSEALHGTRSETNILIFDKV